MRIVTCEQVSDGHPDKICDQISDAVVSDCLKHDKDSRVAIECLAKGNKIIIAGELTSKHKPDYKALVGNVLDRIGRDKVDYGESGPELEILVSEQSADIALGVDIGGAGDQGVMYGYATCETEEMLPIPYVLATRFLKELKALGDERLKADAKAQVSYDYDTGRIVSFLCSVQHRADCDPRDFEDDLKGLMFKVAESMELDGDFGKLVNPTGRFVTGGPFADCGLTGRKLACDTYGGVGRIGGGALSGKDPTKVDRSAAYMARKIAKDIVRKGYCAQCEVQIAYAIGVCDPVAICVNDLSTGKVKAAKIYRRVAEYDLTPAGIIHDLGLLDVDYNLVSSYGHFTRKNLPWEVETKK